MASSTAGSRAGRSARVGTRNGMPASRMRRFARTRRCAIAAGCTANTRAMRVRVEAEHDLEHERGAHRGVDRRVRAREQQLQPLVGDRVRVGLGERGRDVVVQWRRGAHGRGGEQVADAVAGHGHEPPLRVVGDAGRRPGAQRPLEGVGERILGERDVPCRGREQRHEPAVRRPARHASAAARASSVGHLTGCAPCHEPST